MINNDDYYKILGIGYGASNAEIKDAFRRLTKLYHPDRHSNSQQSHKKYIEIVEAFTVLSDSARREEYDRKIAVFKSGPFYTYTNNAYTDFQKYRKTGAPFDSGPNNDRNPYEKDSEKSPSIYCPYCGKGHISIDAEFCDKCGKSMTYDHNGNKREYAAYQHSRNSTITSQKLVNEKIVIALALIGGFFGVNGIGHFMVRKIFFGFVIMFIGWIILASTFTSDPAKLVYLSYILLQTYDAYRRARILNRR